MTSPLPDASTAALAGDVRAVYDELGAMRERAAALRTIEEARAAYQALLAPEEKELERLQRDRDALEQEQRRRRIRPDAPVQPPWPGPKPAPRDPRGSTGRKADTPVSRPPSADRRRLRKLVTRYQFAWRIDQAVVAQVNSIVDDTDRPLGEALSLLDWHVYEQPIPGEPDAEHRRRLSDWLAELVAYRDWLAGEISTVETRYRGWLGVWERWRAAREGGDPAERWARFIEASRADRRARAEQIRDEIASMRQTLEHPVP